MIPFAHLHTHTEYSLLDGACGISGLISRVKELGMKHCAITDHGNMYGVVDFYTEAKKQGIKPIIGCEVYMAPRTMQDKVHEYDSKYTHLILLCENQTGYKNLVKLVSKGFIEGFYYKPRIDFELLKKHSEGLIILSACLAGEIPRALSDDDYEAAKRIAEKYIELVGRDNFFIELQDHRIAEQKRINPQLVRLAREVGVGLVATNDIHYLKREDAEYQDVLMCIQMRKTVEDTDRMSFETDEFYVKSPEEMQQLFSYVPEALENTVKIAERCDVEFDFETRHLPSYAVPNGEDPYEYLKKLCNDGLKERYPEITAELTERLNYELEVISGMGFVDYFLIVWDFIHYAKSNGIMVGPGRGSAAGSLVAYTLGITGIDPIKFSLIFERFLNPERVSMPDIDIDFEPTGRQQVINYVVEKYGADKVAQIITFGTMKAKLAVRDVARALNMSYADADRVAKLIPNELNITLEKSLEVVPELKQLYDNDESIKRLIDTSKALEGLARHSGTHAAGVVITGEPILNYLPLQSNDDVITTQFVKDTVERLGLLKMDFLGLRNLTVIENAVKLIEKTRGIKIDINNISYDCKEVFDLISAGDTDGVFQIESPGMKSFMQELKPDRLEDIIAGIALYRPGPMDSIPRYVYNKNHPDEVVYKHPLLEPILDVTYGCMVYQEQVMQIVRDMAGYSLGSADMLRRTISKKKRELMEVERNNFIYGKTDDDGNVIIEGCIRRGIPEQVAIDIFNEMNDFANYAFNKSHAAAYAFITYQTAYLKAYYPVEYMASLISSVESENKINAYLVNCRAHGINKLAPDVNMSEDSFTVEGNDIRFGLSAVKNVGRGFILKIVEERNRNGKFKSFMDFVHRMADKELNKRGIEGLIKCGAFDSLGAKRAELMQIYEQALETESKAAKNTVSGQLTMFEDDDEPEVLSVNVPEFPKSELLRMEKETMGIYMSGHPMEEYADVIPRITDINIGRILDEANSDEELNAKETLDGKNVVICAIISARKNKTTSKNTQMAFVDIEDLYGTLEMIVFPKPLTDYTALLQEENVVAVSGRLSINEEGAKLICQSVSTIEAALDQSRQRQHNAIKSDKKPVKAAAVKSDKTLYIKMGVLDPSVAELALRIVKKYPGDSGVCLFDKTNRRIRANVGVNPSDSLLTELADVFGQENVKVM